MDLRRPVIYPDPKALTFERHDGESDVATRARRVRVSLTNPHGEATQALHVVATSGVMVHCGGFDPTLPPPDLESYVQDCELTFGATHAKTLAVWVLPLDLEDPVVDAGMVHLRHNDGASVAEVTVPVSVLNPQPAAELGPGWYEGVMSLAALSVSETGAPGALTETGARVPLASLSVPVRIHFEEVGTELVATIVDETRTISPHGRLTVRYDETGPGDQLPTVDGTPAWLGAGVQSLDRGAMAIRALEGSVTDLLTVGAQLAVDADETAGRYRGVIGVQLTNEAVGSPGLIWSFDVQPAAPAPALATWEAPDDNVTTERRNPWIERAHDVLSPRRFQSLVHWQAATGKTSLVNCLHSNRARQIGHDVQGLAAPSVLLDRCRETLGQYFGPEFCGAAVSTALDDENVTVTDAFLQNRFEFCEDDTAEPTHQEYSANYECDCDGYQFTASADDGCTLAPAPCSVNLYACPIDRDTVDPLLHAVADEDHDLYLQAATCAARVAAFQDLGLLAPTTKMEDALIAPHSSYHVDDVDWRTGDLPLRRAGARAAIAEGWFHAPDAYADPVPPTHLPFFYDGHAASAEEMAALCLADVRRRVPTAPLPQGEVTLPPGFDVALKDEAAWFALRPHVEELFQTMGCIDLARFHIELDWLQAAASVEVQWADEAEPPEGFTPTASRLLQRRLQQWLTIHSFIARHAATSDRADGVLAFENLESATPVGLSDAIDAMNRAWSTLLYPDYFDLLTQLPAETLARPDYRQDAEESVTLATYFSTTALPSHHEQGLGLPVVILETVAAYLELTDRYLETIEAEAYADCHASDSATVREAKMQRYGEMMRHAVTAQALANSLFARAAGADPQPDWIPAWLQARDKTAGVWRRVTHRADTIMDCTNPLGIDETSIPLYFIEPQTTNQRFFASSDYLLETWAKPAVTRADSLLESYRQAAISQREADIRQLLTEHDNARRIEQLYIQYGTPLRDACGLEDHPETVFRDFVNGKHDLSNCYKVPSSENADCEDRFKEVWSQTNRDDLVEVLEQCTMETAGLRETNLHRARKGLCVMVLEMAKASTYAATFSDPPYHEQTAAKLKSEALKKGWTPLWWWYLEARWGPMEPNACDLGDLPETCGEYWSLSDTHPGLDFTSVPEIMDIASSLVSASSVESFSLDLPWLDSMRIEDCGQVYEFNWMHGSPQQLRITPAQLDKWLARYRAAFGHWFDNPWCLHRKYPTSENGGDCTMALEFDTSPLLSQQCDDYLRSRPLGFSYSTHASVEALFDPEELAECYRGTLSEYELSILAARQQVRQAYTGLLEIQSRYDTTARSCIMIAALHDEMSEAMEDHHRAMTEINRTAGLFGVIGNALAGGKSGLLQGALGAAQAGLQSRRENVDHHFKMTHQKIRSNQDALQCWTGAAQAIAGYSLQVEVVKAALLNLTSARVQDENTRRRLVASLLDGQSVMESESDRFNELPDLRHNYWTDERLERFERELAWAKRLTYLGMLAAEYELQQTFNARKLILEADHPMQLDAAIREIERELASRGINGARPQAKTVIRSLRDDLLRLRSRTDDPDGERKLAPPEEFVAMLQDPASAVFSADGTYLGQGIPFHLQPAEALHHRCAERMWSVSAALHGDLLGVIEPQLPVFLLKRNTAMSQWCDGHGPQGEEFQTAAIRPSVNLFRDGSQTGQAHETEAYSWSFMDAWINVRRHDFYSERYTEGASDELAGRGLYGDYLLLIPYHGFIEKGIPLDRIEDVLLKFDYISVSNGSGLGTVPSDFDVPPFDIGQVRNLQATPGEMQITLSWLPSRAPIATGTYAVYRDGQLLDYVDDTSYLDRGLVPGVSYDYQVSVIDVYGDTLPGVEGSAEALEWTGWGQHVLEANGGLDVFVQKGMDDIDDDQDGTFTVVLLLRDMSDAPSTQYTWSAVSSTGVNTVYAETDDSGGQKLFARRISGSTTVSQLSVTPSSMSGISLQVAEVERSERRVRLSIVKPDGTVQWGGWASTDSFFGGSFLPSYDMFLLSWAGQAQARWGSTNSDMGLVGAVVFRDLLSTQELQALQAGGKPWDVSNKVQRAFDPGAYFFASGSTYLWDIGFAHSYGIAEHKHGVIRNGDETNILPLTP